MRKLCYYSGCVTDTEWAEQLATHTEWCHCREPRCNGDTEQPRHSDYQHNHVDSSGLQVTNTLIVESVKVSEQEQHKTVFVSYF